MRITGLLESAVGSAVSVFFGSMLVVKSEVSLIELLSFIIVAIPTGIWLWWRVFDKWKENKK